MILRRILRAIFWMLFGMFLYAFPHYAIHWWLQYEIRKAQKVFESETWGEAINGIS